MIHVCYLWGGCASACVCMCVCTIFSNDSCIELRYDSGVSATILGNMTTHAHSIHGPCLYSQRGKLYEPFGENVLLVPLEKVTHCKYLVIGLQNITVKKGGSYHRIFPY